MAGTCSFVTAGSGFLGPNLVEQLTVRSWRVTALHRRPSDVRRLSPLPAELVEADILDPEALVRISELDGSASQSMISR